jgi:hypothetical protein
MVLFVSKSKVGSIIRLESFVRRKGKKQNVELATTKKKCHLFEKVKLQRIIGFQD